MAAKRQYQNVVTSAGIARFPHITKKDTEGKYATGKFTTEIVLDEAATAELKRTYREAAKALCPELKDPHLPIRTSKKDGTVSFIFKSTKKPIIMDASGKKLPASTTIDIRGGSKIRVAGVLAAWDKGLTAYMDAVQIIELSQGRETSFDAVEGGFSYDSSHEAVEGSDGADEDEGTGAGRFDL